MRIAAIVLLVALPAAAQAPSTFRSSAQVAPISNDALHVIDLPFEAYRDARKDLADIRIFNANGDAVPIAWAAERGQVVQAATPIDLKFFPVRTVPPAGQPSTEVTVKTPDGTLVSVRGRKPPSPLGEGRGEGRGRAAAWIADASQTTEPVQAVVLDWQPVPGSELLNVRIEGSDDLKSWSTLGSAPLVRLGGQNAALLQNKVEFAPRKVKYLRLTADSQAFDPSAIRAQYAPRGKAPERLVKTVEAARGEQPDDLVYDLGARLPVEALRLLPAQDNAVLVATLMARDEPAQPWRTITRATFYRLQREGVESIAPMREIGRHGARYWQVRLQPGSSQGALPKLEVQWTPARLVFVKQGDTPFHLAFGNPTAPATALPVASVIPDYKTGAEDLLKPATVSPVEARPPPNRWEKLIGEMDARRVTLWAVLVAGVAALGFMAWRLSNQMK